jgi:hypothetical protein
MDDLHLSDTREWRDIDGKSLYWANPDDDELI